MEAECKAVLERALTDYITSAPGILCHVNSSKLRTWIEKRKERYRGLPDDRHYLSIILRDFFFMRPTIYDVKEISSGRSLVSGLRLVAVNDSMKVVGAFRDG